MGLGISESGLIASAFGKDVQDVGTIVQTFDFSKEVMTGDNFLKCGMAPAFGKLNKTTIKDMDDRLKVVIAGTMKQLSNVHDKSWDSVLSTMMQSPLLEPRGEPIARVDKMVQRMTNLNAEEAYRWFTDMIHDAEVLMSTKINADVLEKITAKIGPTIDDSQLSFENQYLENTVLDLGVLRFPDAEQPFFKLYRIKLDAWSTTERILGQDAGSSKGINGEYHCRMFKPRESVVNGMAPGMLQKGSAQADDMFE